MTSDSTACLLITCPDRPGIVAAVSGFLFGQGANITDLDQHSTDPNGGTFFMRLEFQTDSIKLPRGELERVFAREVGDRFKMDWRIRYLSDRPKLAVMVSKHDHALLDLMWAWRRGDLRAEISMVISNHSDLRTAVEWFGVPFEHVPVEQEMAGAEDRMLELLRDRADLVVLARYMRILSGGFVRHYPSRIINIHHSFLPAFVGSDPYGQAHQHGVKLVGATAHYVVEALDAGPIIEQDVTRVSHRQSVADLRALGRDLERLVLTRAVRWHLEERVLVHGNKTVVFA